MWRLLAPDIEQITDDALTRQKIHGLAEPAEENPDVTTIPTVPVLDDSGSESGDGDGDRRRTKGSSGRRKRRRVGARLFHLPPLANYVSEEEESEEER